MNNKIIWICLVVSSLLFVNIASAQLNTEAPDELTALLNQLLGEEESSVVEEPATISQPETGRMYSYATEISYEEVLEPWSNQRIITLELENTEDDIHYLTDLVFDGFIDDYSEYLSNIYFKPQNEETTYRMTAEAKAFNRSFTWAIRYEDKEAVVELLPNQKTVFEIYADVISPKAFSLNILSVGVTGTNGISNDVRNYGGSYFSDLSTYSIFNLSLEWNTLKKEKQRDVESDNLPEGFTVWVAIKRLWESNSIFSTKFWEKNSLLYIAKTAWYYVLELTQYDADDNIVTVEEANFRVEDDELDLSEFAKEVYELSIESVQEKVTSWFDKELATFSIYNPTNSDHTLESLRMTGMMTDYEPYLSYVRIVSKEDNRSIQNQYGFSSNILFNGSIIFNNLTDNRIIIPAKSTKSFSITADVAYIDWDFSREFYPNIAYITADGEDDSWIIHRWSSTVEWSSDLSEYLRFKTAQDWKRISNNFSFTSRNTDLSSIEAKITNIAGDVVFSDTFTPNEGFNYVAQDDGYYTLELVWYKNGVRIDSVLTQFFVGDLLPDDRPVGKIYEDDFVVEADGRSMFLTRDPDLYPKERLEISMKFEWWTQDFFNMWNPIASIWETSIHVWQLWTYLLKIHSSQGEINRRVEVTSLSDAKYLWTIVALVNDKEIKPNFEPESNTNTFMGGGGRSSGNIRQNENNTPSTTPTAIPINSFVTTKPTSNPATKSTPAVTTKTFVDYTRRPVDKNVTIQSINKRSEDDFGWVSRTTHYKSFPAYLDKRDLGKVNKPMFQPVSYAQRMALAWAPIEKATPTPTSSVKAPAPAPALSSWSNRSVVDKEVYEKFLAGAYFKGDKDAKITIIEFSDVQCPFCQRHANNRTLDDVREKYSDDVNLSFGHFPLSFHQNAQKAAEALECAGKISGENKFFEFKGVYFEKGWDSNIDIAKEAAAEVGIPVESLMACVDWGEFEQKVKDQMAFGQSLWVTGTPGNIVINNETLEYTKISGAVPANAFDGTISMDL